MPLRHPLTNQSTWNAIDCAYALPLRSSPNEPQSHITATSSKMTLYPCIHLSSMLTPSHDQKKWCLFSHLLPFLSSSTSQLKYCFARRKGALFTHNYPSSITRPSTRGQAPARPPSRHSFTGGNYTLLALGQPLDTWSLSARPLGGTLHFLWELTAQLCDASALWQCHIHTSEA